MKNYFSKRIQSLSQSTTIATTQKVKLLKAKGTQPIDLSIGEPSFATPSYIQQAAKEAIDTEKYFSYAPVAGYDDLRRAIAQKFNRENKIPCTQDNIVVSTGAKQAIANVFFCLLNPGDEVVVYAPYWVSYTSMIKLAGGVPVYIHGASKNNFQATANQLKQAITPKTKAIIYSSPCNPTGMVFSKAALQEIAQVIASYEHIFIIADEIYEYINYTTEHISIGAFEEVQDRTITINGLSKGHAMTGWRIGYMAAPTLLAKACEKLQGQITSSSCSIAQRAALTAIQGNREDTQRMQQQYLKRRDLVMKLLQAIPNITCNQPQGAFYVFPNISAYFGKTDGKITIHSAHDFCQYLLQTAHVAMVAGDAFGNAQCVRISYAVTEKKLEKAFCMIKKALEQLK